MQYKKNIKCVKIRWCLFMEYVIANLNDIDEIIKIKDEVKLRLKEEKLKVWLGDYPTYELIGFSTLFYINFLLS